MRVLAASVLLVSGCLPAYQNGSLSTNDASLDDLTMMSVGDGGCSGSGKFVTGSLYSIEQQLKVPGPVVHISDFVDQPAFSSMPADNAGKFKLEIPDCVINDMVPRYFVIDGMIGGLPMVTTWIAPRLPMTGMGVNNVNTVLHPFQNQDDGMGVRGLLESTLKTHGDIPMNKSLKSDYSWMYGWFADITNSGISAGTTGAVAVLSVPGDGGMITLDNTNCKPDVQCCVYYSYYYDDFKFAMPQPPSFIDFSATSSFGGWLAVVCPGDETGDITITQTAALTDLHDYKNSNKPKANFPAITAPRIVGSAVFLDWQN